MKTDIAVAGRSAMMPVHALCLFLCTPSLNRNENPSKSATSFKEKEQFCCVLLMFFAFVGLGKALGDAAGVRLIHSTNSKLNKNPISKP